MSDNRPIIYRENNNWVLRASALWRCPSEILGVASGMESESTPSWFQGALEDGNTHEEVVKARLERLKFTITGEQDEIDLKIGNIIIRGHLDGTTLLSPLIHDVESITKLKNQFPRIQSWEGEACVLEIKSMNEEMFSLWRAQAFTAFPHYAAQATIYMRKLNLPLIYVVQCRNKSLDLDMRFYPEPPMPFVDVVKRIQHLSSMLETGEMPPCMSDGFARKYCKIPGLHIGGDILSTNETPKLVRVDDADLALKLQELVNLKTQTSKMESKVKELEKSVKDKVPIGQGIIAGNYQVKWGKGREYFDQQQWAVDHPGEVDKYKKVGNPSFLPSAVKGT